MPRAPVARLLTIVLQPPLARLLSPGSKFVEGAGLRAPNPRVVAGWRETEDSERGGQRQDLPRAFDRSEQQSLPSLVRHAAALEREPRDAEQGKDEPEDRDEHGGPALQPEDTSAKCRLDFVLGL
ncbi:MAG: hypothetical protein IPI67_20280 [Myxococcales bacterium]|nr:hypothetical protein [Myxococcales bacterium]